MKPDAPDDSAPEKPAGSTLKRAVLISLAIVGLLVGGLAIASWMSADPETLPFDYDGFN